ncbi:unnamed protein product [Cercospora beticola]|nr:unnamed protein product [Cercospora beticola]
MPGSWSRLILPNQTKFQSKAEKLVQLIKYLKSGLVKFSMIQRKLVSHLLAAQDLSTEKATIAEQLARTLIADTCTSSDRSSEADLVRAPGIASHDGEPVPRDRVNMHMLMIYWQRRNQQLAAQISKKICLGSKGCRGDDVAVAIYADPAHRVVCIACFGP